METTKKTIKCSICECLYGSWRVHCPACGTLCVPLIRGYEWRKVCVESDTQSAHSWREIGRARGVVTERQLVARGQVFQSCDCDA